MMISNTDNISRMLAIGLLCTLSAWTTVQAETPQDFLAGFEQEAKTDSADFKGFDALRGEQFFTRTHGNDWSCASCHTSNPTKIGKHAKTDKEIQPLAPTANAKRFTDPRKVAKWFKRNCNDVLERECTVLEKGDILTFLLASKP